MQMQHVHGGGLLRKQSGVDSREFLIIFVSELGFWEFQNTQIVAIYIVLIYNVVQLCRVGEKLILITNNFQF